MEGLQRRGRETRFSGLLTAEPFLYKAPEFCPGLSLAARRCPLLRASRHPRRSPVHRGRAPLPAQPSGGTALRGPSHLPRALEDQAPELTDTEPAPFSSPTVPPLPALRLLRHLPGGACAQPVPGSGSGGAQPGAAQTWSWIQGSR